MQQVPPYLRHALVQFHDADSVVRKAFCLEVRVALWRAEIEDERKEDMGEVAAALMEIG